MVMLFLLLLILIIKTNSQLKENPIYLTDKKNFFVLDSTDSYYYVITSGESFKIEKESGNIINSSDNNINISNSIFIEDLSGNNYIYNSDEYYYINYNPFIFFEKESRIFNYNQNNFRIINSIGRINDFIIYGYDKEELIFCEKSESRCNSVDFNDFLDDRISCKLSAEEYYFICGLFINSQLNIYYLRQSKNGKQELSLNNKYIGFNSSSHFGLYDTTENSNIKLLCQKNDTIILCYFFKWEALIFF